MLLCEVSYTEVIHPIRPHACCSHATTAVHVATLAFTELAVFFSSMWLVGGEKSYTTVAFALALGEWTQSPFRAMDEFDVFMDAINRRVAMENLFSNSLEHPDLQFIFLTPQVGMLAQGLLIMFHSCLSVRVTSLSTVHNALPKSPGYCVPQGVT